MNASLLPLALLLLQWTLLLGLGWGAHALFRDRHPRWRLILWRSILCFGVALPLVSLLRLPRFNVPAPRLVVPSRLLPDAALPAPSASAAPNTPRLAPGVPRQRSSSAAIAAAPAIATPPVEKTIGRATLSWPWLLAIVWLGGCGWEAIRLLRLHCRLRQIVGRAPAADASVQSLARQIRTELKIARCVRVRVSDAISSPFLCGLIEPTILIPRRLAQDLPPAEINALLSHEMAHQCRHDLVWCIAWRLMKAVYWFHPLAWKVPDVHTLACEEEADRIATARVDGSEGYPRLLAQLALRVAAIRPVESGLSLNATSHIARRLIQLGRGRAGAWRLKHSVAGFVLAGVLLLLTGGWQFAQAGAETTPARSATEAVLITVQDEDGRPIEGATISPDGLRAKGDDLRGSHHGWRPQLHGPAEKAITDREGKARVEYPLAINAEEKLLTGAISFAVDHPKFSGARFTDFQVDGTGKALQMKRGIPIRITGYFGAGRERVTNIVPNLIGEPQGVRPEEWIHEGNGALAWRRMSPGKHFLHVAGRLASGEMVYSDGVVFFGEQRDSHEFTLEMKPGVRVEGVIDKKVARPIKNGWVQLSVHSDDANIRQLPVFLPKTSGNTGFWWSYRSIADDGSFVFESVPPGDLKVIAYGDGFVSANGEVELAPSRYVAVPPSEPVRRVTRGVPQSFACVQPVTPIEVVTEATATLKVIAKINGKPVAGATVHVSPSVIQMPTGSRVFGGGGSSSEASFRHLPPLPEPRPMYIVSTDKNGIAVLRNLPAFTQFWGLEHAQYEIRFDDAASSAGITRFQAPPPLNRYAQLTLSPGLTTQVEVALQPKGRESRGTNP
jgi:beta-lactamase regulating signal transducer with metallopeptidase domain